MNADVLFRLVSIPLTKNNEHDIFELMSNKNFYLLVFLCVMVLALLQLHQKNQLLVAHKIVSTEEVVCTAYQELAPQLSKYTNAHNRPFQQAPPVGFYPAARVYQRGVERNLDEIDLFGHTASVTINDDGTAVFDLLGVNIYATYDRHYLYAQDGAPLAYSWDGHTLAASFHRLDFYFERQNDSEKLSQR